MFHPAVHLLPNARPIVACNIAESAAVVHLVIQTQSGSRSRAYNGGGGDSKSKKKKGLGGESGDRRRHGVVVVGWVSVKKEKGEKQRNEQNLEKGNNEPKMSSLDHKINGPNGKISGHFVVGKSHKRTFKYE